jgi:4-amino-4-deoxy-L-arabinose transferase-like glycosyltransferase
LTASERALPIPPSSPEPEPGGVQATLARAIPTIAQRVGSAARARLALGFVLGLAATLYVWNLTVSGYANTYYAMAAQAASKDWSAFFFGSLDPANFITLDKPPAAVWLMGLSVRLLGLSSWSILLPQALLGIATVGILFVAVRRPFGTPAALIAAVVMALTPAATLIFRYDNPDALLTFVLVTAAWALGRGLENGRLRWPIAAAALVGLAFLTKYLQAYLVLPAFALVWLMAAPGSVRRRIVGLAAAAVTVAVTSGWWVAIVELLPASSRPYIGGSTNNSILDLVLGYDGLGRIFGQGIGDGNPTGGSPIGGSPIGLLGGGGAGPGTGPGAGFGGSPGLLRLFNVQFGGEISWLIPLALVSLATGLLIYRHAPRPDRRRAGYVLWGTWLVVHVLVFSLMSGIAHPYYAVMLAPAIGALVGAGVIDLWRRSERHVLAPVMLAGGIVASAAWGLVVLGRVPSFVPGLGIAAVALAVAAGLVLVLPAAAVDRRLQRLAFGLGLVAVLAGPAAYSAATMTRGLAGGDPSAGPASAATGVPGGGGGAGPGGGVDAGLVDYLLANQGAATWIVAAQGSGTAASIQLAADEPVLTMGGFSGTDAAPTLAEVRALVGSGALRYVLVGGQGGPGPRGPANSGVTSWVGQACTIVDVGSAAAGSLYDCAGAG